MASITDNSAYEAWRRDNPQPGGNFLGFGRGDNPIQRLTYRVYQGVDPATGQPRYGPDQAYGTSNMPNIDRLLQDPQGAELLARMRQQAASGQNFQATSVALQSRARALGIEMDNGREFAVDPQGNLGFRTRDVVNDYVYPIATVAAGALLGAGIWSGIGGGLGAGGANAATPSVAGQVASTASGIGAGGGAAAGAAPAGYVTGQVASTASGIGAGGGAAAGGGGGMAGQIGSSGFTWKDAIGGGASMIGAWQDNKNKKADRELTLQEIQLQEIQGAEAAAQARERLRLEQEASARSAQSDAYQKAMIGAVGRNIQDVRFDRSGFSSNVANVSFQGGARPSVLGETGRANAALLEQQASDALRNPTPAPVLPPQERIRFWQDPAVLAAQRQPRGK